MSEHMKPCNVQILPVPNASGGIKVVSMIKLRTDLRGWYQRDAEQKEERPNLKKLFTGQYHSWSLLGQFQAPVVAPVYTSASITAIPLKSLLARSVGRFKASPTLYKNDD
jgi:hypothetical protein